MVRDGERWGLRRNRETRFAKNESQMRILKALYRQNQSLGELTRVLDPDTEDGEDSVSLVLAEFILDFGNFLED